MLLWPKQLHCYQTRNLGQKESDAASCQFINWLDYSEALGLLVLLYKWKKLLCFSFCTDSSRKEKRYAFKLPLVTAHHLAIHHKGFVENLLLFLHLRYRFKISVTKPNNFVLKIILNTTDWISYVRIISVIRCFSTAHYLQLTGTIY